MEYIKSKLSLIPVYLLEQIWVSQDVLIMDVFINRLIGRYLLFYTHELISFMLLLN